MSIQFFLMCLVSIFLHGVLVIFLCFTQEPSVKQASIPTTSFQLLASTLLEVPQKIKLKKNISMPMHQAKSPVFHASTDKRIETPKDCRNRVCTQIKQKDPLVAHRLTALSQTIKTETQPSGTQNFDEHITQSALTSIEKILHQKINENKMYPVLARRLNLEGQVNIAFWLDKEGIIGGTQIELSSGSEILDNAATQAVRAISPVIEAKEYISHRIFFKIPVIFKEEG